MVKLDPEEPPGFHVYVLAPPAVSVADAPLQTVADVAVTAGKAFTVIVPVAVFVQVVAAVPVTV